MDALQYLKSLPTWNIALRQVSWQSEVAQLDRLTPVSARHVRASLITTTAYGVLEPHGVSPLPPGPGGVASLPCSIARGSWLTPDTKSPRNAAESLRVPLELPAVPLRPELSFVTRTGWRLQWAARALALPRVQSVVLLVARYAARVRQLLSHLVSWVVSW